MNETDNKLAEVRVIRPTCKALIIKNGKLLTIRKLDTDGTYNFLPGGGQVWGETLVTTLRRECKEEIK